MDLDLTDFSMATSTPANVAGFGMMTTLGSTLNQVANILSGPVLWVVLAAATVMILYGLAEGSSRQGAGDGPNGPSHFWTVMGFGLYLLVAILRGLASYLHGL